MKLLLLTLFYLLCSELCFAQTSNSFLVKAGMSISESVPATELYQYAEFKNGILLFKSGDKSQGKLNYNRYFDEMQFIDPAGDTLSLADEATIKLIVVEQDSFYWDAGIVKLVSSMGERKLAIKQTLKIVDHQKVGAYDMASSTTSITSVNSITNGGRRFNLAVKEDLLLSKEVHYYLGDKYNHFILANRKNLLDNYPKDRDVIKKYLKENEVAFTEIDDLQKLLRFLATL